MDGRDAARVLANTAGRGAMLKVGGIAAVCFIVFLLILGTFGAGVGAGGQAYASSCGDRGTPQVDDGGDSGNTGQTGTKLREQQIENAKTIDTVAQDSGLSGRATLIALMASLQEATLLNLHHGDRDSVGLFQMRPSQGWGTAEQLIQPTYAAKMFFLGGDGGDPRGLADVKGWETMPLGNAAQEVEKSAYPDLYAGEETAARDIAQEADINLDRAGTATSSPTNGDQADGGNTGTTQCSDGSTGSTGKPGAPFHDGAAGWPSVVRNPRSTEAAIAWAEDQSGTASSSDWYRRCLAFVAQAYGWSGSGWTNPPANTHAYAIELYRNLIPASMHHDGDRNPPPGALMFWETSSDAGHVAIYLGGGKIASNDIERPGYIDVVPATEIESKWGSKYVGWAPPYFPNGG